MLAALKTAAASEIRQREPFLRQFAAQIKKQPELLARLSPKYPYPTIQDFPRLFFDRTEDLYIPRELEETQQQMFQPGSSKVFLYLKIDEKASRVAKSLAEVRDEAVRQWKLQQARELARKEANEIARKLKGQKNNDDDRSRLLRDYEKQLGQKLIALGQVAPIIKPPMPVMDPRMPFPQTQKPYEYYKIPAQRFEYPREKEWTEKILEMEKPGKEVQILTNKPEMVFYVAARVRAPEASDYFFRAVYNNTPVEDPIRVLCMRKFAQDQRVEVVEYLKKKMDFKDLRSADSRKKDKEPNPDRVETEVVFGID
jgi:hypothetical protein